MNRGLSSFVALFALGLVAPAFGQLSLTFDSDAQGFTGAVTWVASVPGWSGGGVIQQSSTAGGWTLGNGPKKEYDFFNGQAEMQALANSGTAQISFDVILDANSFPVDAGTWYQLIVAGNSDGAAGWTQSQFVGSWRNQGDTQLITNHYVYNFSDLGWQPGDQWFQIYFGSNSDGDKPIKFYVDNVVATPEPTTGLLMLAGLALLAPRRRA